MREDILKLPVKNAADLSSFDKQMSNLTTGFSLKRSMAYCEFRMAVLRSQQTKETINDKFFLPNNHYISIEEDVVTLYRYVEDEHIETFSYNDDESNEDERLRDDTAKKRKCNPL
jgi:hypothetical protein